MAALALTIALGIAIVYSASGGWSFHRPRSGVPMRDFLIAAAVLVIPVGLITRQPDLGTALLIFASGFFVIFHAGLSWRVLGSLVVACALTVPFLWPMLHDYQRK